MAMKKDAKEIKINSYAKGVGRRSRRRSGVIVQSIRLLTVDNNMLHDAAKAEGISFNGWATKILTREAAKVLKRKEAAKQKKVTEE
jgi:predicted HicB family RNase H-like nuclease